MNAVATKTATKKTAKWEVLSAEKAKKLIGFRSVTKEEKSELAESDPSLRVYTHKLLGYFVLENNVTNRSFTMSRAERLGKKFLNGTFAGMQNSPSETDNGESWIFNGDGSVLSCAHRLVGLILAQAEREVYVSTNPDWLVENDVPDIINVTALLVRGIHDPAANTIDTGDPRRNKDVYFRNPEMLQGYTATDKAKLAGELQKAVRLVWCRLDGTTDQTGRGKFENEQAIKFLSDHPLIEKAVIWMFEEDGKESVSKGGKRLTKYHGGLTVGVLAGCFYLAYLSTADRQLYFDDPFTLGKLNSDQWDQVESFFLDIRRLDDGSESGIKKADSPIVANMIDLFRENKDVKKKVDRWGRDDIQSVIAMSYLSHFELSNGKYKTPQGIKKGLTNEVVRFNTFDEDGMGLDLPMTVLKNNGWIVEAPKSFRTTVDSWTVGDQAWIYRGYDFEEFKALGKIIAFSIDGTEVTMEGMGDNEGKKSKHPVANLCVDEPTLPTTCMDDKFQIGDDVTVLYELDEEGKEIMSEGVGDDGKPYQASTYDPWNGTIRTFSDDGQMAGVSVFGYDDPEPRMYDIDKQLEVGHIEIEEPVEA